MSEAVLGPGAHGDPDNPALSADEFEATKTDDDKTEETDDAAALPAPPVKDKPFDQEAPVVTEPQPSGEVR